MHYQFPMIRHISDVLPHIEGRHYEMYSGTAMMDEVRDLKQMGYKVE